MLDITFVTLFPEPVLSAIRHSVLARAEASGLVSYDACNPRDFALDERKSVDARPVSGGPGMVLRADIVGAALDSLDLKDAEVVFPDPNGEPFNQLVATELNQASKIVFVCGHYEGIDDRVRQKFATRSLSLGDYILSGGEFAALVMADAIVRLIPGTLGEAKSLDIDAHSDGLLSSPQYAQPDVWQGLIVPEILKSGDHVAIDKWKRQIALRETRRLRPDLFCKAPLSRSDLDLL